MPAFDFVSDVTGYEPKNALWLGRAAKLAYEDETTIRAAVASWGLTQFRFFSREDTQAFVAANDSLVLVAFRGTEPTNIKDWMTDADIAQADGPGGRVHDGFQRALGSVYREIRSTISDFQTRAQSLWVTGHSLGAALATLAVARLRLLEDKPVYGLYTFGSPRVGDRNFERAFNADFKPHAFRFVNNNDIVTRVPPRELKYSHVGTFLYFDSNGELHWDIARWFELLDGVKGSIDDFLKPGPDALKDHAMENYVGNLERNLSVHPEL